MSNVKFQCLFYIQSTMNKVNKLIKTLGENTKLSPVEWENTYHGINTNKKWIANVLPSELLSQTVKYAIEHIVSLSESGIFYKKFPDKIETPNYGDNWGRFANYIEINNRSIAEMRKNKCCCGILSCIKILPAIPPSAKSWANCIILSQIFPNIYGDGYNKEPNEENSIYGIKLNAGYSKNIISENLKISAEDQFKAFNDLAHFRGLKTGFRTVISADQIKVETKHGDLQFEWCNKEHEKLFIHEHKKLIDLGFDCIFVDSAKHIGGYECESYTGIGDLPEYHQIQHILHEIRKHTGKTNISIVGEKSSNDFERYRLMGLNAGTDYITGDNFNNVRDLSERLKYYRDYAPGVEVENDNNMGGLSYEQMLNRINTALFGFYLASDKLPSFMQMGDLFPLRYDTNTHHLMISNPSYSQDGEPLSHWENLFTKDDGRFYNHKVGELFAHALGL